MAELNGGYAPDSNIGKFLILECSCGDDLHSTGNAIGASQCVFLLRIDLGVMQITGPSFMIKLAWVVHAHRVASHSENTLFRD